MKNLSDPAEAAKGGAVWGAPASLQLCRETWTQLWGAECATGCIRDVVKGSLRKSLALVFCG